MAQKAIIGIMGGSGLYAMTDFKVIRKMTLKTPFGKPSDSFLMGELSGIPVAFLPRHGVGHRFNPSEINYRANIWGMKKLGVQAILSVSAVGSLKEEIRPGHIVIVDQFIDRTRGFRKSTFFEKGVVAHVSFADPVCPSLRELVIKASKDSGAVVHEKGTYICMEGPLFSTRAESNWYRSLNADVIGMTNLTEAKLAREASLCYVTIALSTDYDCWHQSLEPVSTEQILCVLRQNIELAQKIIGQSTAGYLKRTSCCCEAVLKNAVMTDSQKIPQAAKKRLQILLGST